MPVGSPPRRGRAVLIPAAFHRWCERVARRLPLGLDHIVAPTLLGFCLINSATFGVDLMVLVGLRGGLGVPYPLAVTIAYACAFGSSYALNRYLNFRSHAPVGQELTIYVAVVVINYLVFILALSTLLTDLGLDYRLARLAVGGCEAVHLYCALRWVVFRKVR